ncbi:hypothetical protein [Gordonia sp. MP11Mi]|uniref:Secreted protein n=1 Tax=Gordonia sp. MP11Mi TaxID=3022769 RepID=A0AA97CTM3_9ACTN
MRTRRITLAALAATAAGAGILAGTPGQAHASYINGWTDIVNCDQAPAVGAIVPITDTFNHKTKSSPWVQVNQDSAGYFKGYRSYEVQFDQARVVKADCDSSGHANVEKTYEAGEMTITNRVDWSNGNGTAPIVPNQLHERVNISDLRCEASLNVCLPASVANGG